MGNTWSSRPSKLSIDDDSDPQNPQMNTNRDSFDVRIDDDLFEVIVSYLPIKDKLRYESVSKRFQRFVFNKQKILRISCFSDSVNNLNEDYLYSRVDMNVTNLSKLLKKFRFITTLEILSRFMNMTEVMETITEYCNHLTAIRITLLRRPVDNNGEVLPKVWTKFETHLV